MTFQSWRWLHRLGSLVSVAGAVGAFVGRAAAGLEPLLWLVGAPLGVALRAARNWAQVGVEPCEQPTAKVVRTANTIYAVGAAIGWGATGSPWLGLLVAGALLQVVAGRVTLRRSA
jgi:hypothetical protein